MSLKLFDFMCRQTVFSIFFASFILWGLTESYWIAYPFSVFRVAGTVLDMGIVYALSGLLIAGITFVVFWISDVKKIAWNLPQ